jgi:exodeoxyribonuclease V alpha subunit
VCLDLQQLVAEQPHELAPPGAELGATEVLEARHWMDPAVWRQAVEESPLVEGEGAPLVLDSAGRIYLARYFGHQERLAGELLSRAGRTRDDLDLEVLRDGILRLFPSAGSDLQRVGALTAVLRSFSVISGGPGTGKTATVVRILALLIEQALARGESPPTALLFAPTGKAAARMGAAIRSSLEQLDVSDEVRAAIPLDAKTIHRGLGSTGRPTRFRHGRDSPLVADVVIVDEASMIAFALLARLVDAVPRGARLVLLGDKDQLASVEAGAVLGDICNAGEPWGYSPGWASRIASFAGDDLGQGQGPVGEVGDCVVQLTHSWRFGDDSGVGSLARAVNAGDAPGVLALLRGSDCPDVRLVEFSGELPSALVNDAMDRFGPWVAADDVEGKLRAFGRFRILCAHRRGRYGADAVNRRVAARVPADAGEPVLVTENDYVLDLYNGDVGMVMETADGLRAFFGSPGGDLRSFAPARLPGHSACYAMTVHKSQGSEFDHVAVLLPGEPSPILTRELLYTAVTRARVSVTVYSPASILRSAVERRIERASGLRDILWRRGP